MSDQDDKNSSEVIIGSPIDDAGTRPVLRDAGNSYEFGSIRPLKDGQPSNGGQLVTLKREDGRYYMTPITESKDGPAMVNSHEYKKNWTNIFGNRTVGQA